MTQISQEAYELLAKHVGNGSSALSAIQEVLDERDALRKALDCVKTDFDTVAGENDALHARVQELEVALRPFIAEHESQEQERSPHLLDSNKPHTFYRATYGDLRRAAETLGGGA